MVRLPVSRGLHSTAILDSFGERIKSGLEGKTASAAADLRSGDLLGARDRPEAGPVLDDRLALRERARALARRGRQGAFLHVLVEGLEVEPSLRVVGGERGGPLEQRPGARV